MGLYDRDYMRETPAGEPDESSGTNRRLARRRVIIIGFVLLLATMIAMLASK